jgi:hypothetical protein
MTPTSGWNEYLWTEVGDDYVKFERFEGVFSIEVVPFPERLIGPTNPNGPATSARAEWGMEAFLRVNANNAEMLGDMLHTVSLVSVTDSTGALVPGVTFGSGLTLSSSNAVPEPAALTIWGLGAVCLGLKTRRRGLHPGAG